ADVAARSRRAPVVRVSQHRQVEDRDGADAQESGRTARRLRHRARHVLSLAHRLAHSCRPAHRRQRHGRRPHPLPHLRVPRLRMGRTLVDRVAERFVPLIRGTALLATRAYLAKKHGPDAFDRAVLLLRPEHAAVWRAIPLAHEWYSHEAVLALDDAAA